MGTGKRADEGEGERELQMRVMQMGMEQQMRMMQMGMEQQMRIATAQVASQSSRARCGGRCDPSGRTWPRSRTT